MVDFGSMTDEQTADIITEGLACVTSEKAYEMFVEYAAENGDIEELIAQLEEAL